MSADGSRRRWPAVRRALDLVVTVRPIDDDVPASPAGAPWTVTVYGADHPGIVHGVTALLARRGVNIVDLDDAGHRRGRPAGLRHAPRRHPAGRRRRRVWLATSERAAGDLGVECTLRADDADIL